MELSPWPSLCTLLVPTVVAGGQTMTGPCCCLCLLFHCQLYSLTK